MSLRFVHLVFIAAAVVLAVWTGWWAWERYAHGVGAGWGWLAAACGASALGLVAYGVWFVRKTRGVSFL